MPVSKNPRFIDWAKSEARGIILDDLLEGTLPLTEAELSTEAAWEIYRQYPEFVKAGVVIEQFKDRLKDHRPQITDKKRQSTFEQTAFEYDMQLHPRKTHNERGEPVFDLHPAKPLLQEDVRMKLHKQMLPSDLRATRPEYQAFKPNIFRQHIYQEVRRQKVVFYLNVARAAKLRKARGRRPDLQATNHA
jgi:hypothetical protein